MDTATDHMRSHTKTRFRQRMGIKYTKNIRKHILKGIKRGRYHKIRNQGETKEFYLIDDIGRFPFKVVYCKDVHEIITMLYLTNRERNNFGYNKFKGTNNESQPIRNRKKGGREVDKQTEAS